MVRRWAILVVLSSAALAARSDEWSVASDAHFQVYSQTGPDSAHRALIWFEQLRTFFQQNGLKGASFSDAGKKPLQVIGFRSQAEYDEYRLHPTADAFFVSVDNSDYIIMAGFDQRQLGVAAHEYSHYILHLSGVNLPPWMNEGLAEYFSTLRVGKDGYEVGGDLPGHTQVLRRNTWLPFAELFKADRQRDSRSQAAIFYAESWALVDMLMTSPRYSPAFDKLVSTLNSGSDVAAAVESVYGISTNDLWTNLQHWTIRPAHLVASPPSELTEAHENALSEQDTGALLARASYISGHLDQARSRYLTLAREDPLNPEFPAALGQIANRQGDRTETLKQWRKAFQNHSSDPDLCYQLGILIEETDNDSPEAKAAWERAISLQPDFDDARYKLALLATQEGDYRLAVDQFRAMRPPPAARRFAYWIGLASALTELDQRADARQAAEEALKAASNDAERHQARMADYMAATDLSVQLSTDAEGHQQMVTTRVPHGVTERNPFIEPSDQIQHSSGKLAEVLCAGGQLTGFVLHTSSGLLTVHVPNPTRVLMRNSPTEFYCGPTQSKDVEADYAVMKTGNNTTNLLRGMAFH